MPRRRLAAVLLAGALAVAACGDAADDDTGVAPDPSTGTAVGSTPSSTTGADGEAAVPEQLDFVAPDVRGGQVVGADYAGQDLVVWFWAPW